MKDASKPRIVPARLEHLDGMARCHIACFRGQFMSEMGQRFVKDHYRAFLAFPRGLAVVAVGSDDADVLGLIAGGPHGVSRGFLRRARKQYIGRMLWKAVTNSAVRSALWQRVFSKGRREEERDIVRDGEGPPPGPQTGYLQTICVLENCRGSGMAGRLLAGFTGACREKGFTRLALAVSSENGRAIAFYGKNGWRAFKRGPVTTHMWLDLGGSEAGRDAEGSM